MSRHPAVQQILQHFTFAHLPPHLARISRDIHETAYSMVDWHELEGPELTTGLRKLLEAKDCFVRAAVEKARAAEVAARPPLHLVGGEHHVGQLHLGGAGESEVA